MPSASLQVLEAWKEANYSLQAQPRAYLQPTLLLQGGCEVAASLGDLDTYMGGRAVLHQLSPFRASLGTVEPPEKRPACAPLTSGFPPLPVTHRTV